MNRRTVEAKRSTKRPRNHHERTLLQTLRGFTDQGMPLPMAHYSVDQNRHLLKHGRFYNPATRPDRYKMGPRGLGWYNSLVLSDNHPELTYVEGYAYYDHERQFPAVEHGWCVTTDGQVVDVTWAKPGLAYFGVEFDRQTVRGSLVWMALEQGGFSRIMVPQFATRVHQGKLACYAERHQDGPILSTSVVHCPECGEPLDRPDDEWTCPSGCDLTDFDECQGCQAVLVSGSDGYCEECAIELEEDEE